MNDLPHLYLLHGAFVSAMSWLTNGALDIIDNWMTTRRRPLLVVMPDAWTSVGGSQYLDSPAIGNYDQYLVNDVVAEVDAAIPALRTPRHRYLVGHSSGGLGAYNLAVRHPGLFRSIAMLAPDVRFEGVHLATANDAQRELTLEYGSSWARFETRIRGTEASAVHPALIDQYMLAHAYSTGRQMQPLIDTATGMLNDDVWRSWLLHDPIRRAETDRTALRDLDGIYIAGGSQDPTYSDLGAQSLHRTLARLEVPSTHDALLLGHDVGPYLSRALDHLIHQSDHH